MLIRILLHIHITFITHFSTCLLSYILMKILRIGELEFNLSVLKTTTFSINSFLGCWKPTTKRIGYFEIIDPSWSKFTANIILICFNFYFKSLQSKHLFTANEIVLLHTISYYSKLCSYCFLSNASGKSVQNFWKICGICS